MTSGALSILIVDDEPIARERIRKLLAQDADVRVVWECASVAEFERLDASIVPNLVFLDVGMPGRDGFDLLKCFDERGHHPTIIFVTAHAKYALKAYAVGAVDYLLKPFEDERFARTIERAKAIIGVGRRAEAVKNDGPRVETPQSRPVLDRLFVSDDRRMLLIPTEDIDLIQAAGKKVKIFVRDDCYLSRQSLRNLEVRLDSNRFIRVHRSTIINVNQIVELHPLLHGDCEVVLKRGIRVILSRRFRSRLVPVLGDLGRADDCRNL
jgi:two-component system, LytTR family, response regulator